MGVPELAEAVLVENPDFTTAHVDEAVGLQTSHCSLDHVGHCPKARRNLRHGEPTRPSQDATLGLFQYQVR